MKELVILSGKGGTGKTSLTAAFATLATGCLLLMHPDIRKQTDFQGGGVALIDLQRCTGCGTCMDMCRWSGEFPSIRHLPGPWCRARHYWNLMAPGLQVFTCGRYGKTS